MTTQPAWTKDIRAIFSDFDDTLTSETQLTASTLKELERLKACGYWLVIVSGRPAGWADCLLRIFPFDAIIFENGAGLMRKEAGKISVETLAKNTAFSEQHGQLQSFFDRMKQKIPSLKLASDQPYRLCDYAIDYAEERPFLNESEIDLVMDSLKKEPGLTGKLSSIHINYWVGNHTKVSAAQHLINQEGKGRGIGLKEIVFFGDSPNDEPLFQHFPHSVGVANIKNFLSKMTFRPSHITQHPGGKGFEEFSLFLG